MIEERSWTQSYLGQSPRHSQGEGKYVVESNQITYANGKADELAKRGAENDEVEFTCASDDYVFCGVAVRRVRLLSRCGLRIMMGLRASHVKLRRLRTTRSFFLTQQAMLGCVSRV